MSRVPSAVQNAPFGPLNPAGRRRPLPQPIVLQPGTAQGLEQTGNRQIDALQQRIATASRVARSSVIADHNVIMGLTLVASTPMVIQHGLGRAFVSCVLCGQSGPGTIAVLRPSAVVRPPSTQNILDQSVVQITPDFDGIADLLIW